MITVLFVLLGLVYTLALDPMTNSLEFAGVMIVQMVISTAVIVFALYTQLKIDDE